jgi:ABC-type protease/lipase transport system fused ATPase/permease subunit
LRALVGVWKSTKGSIRLDGAALDQWSPEKLGSFIGYVPQECGLFDGTVSENIARMRGHPDPELVLNAAKNAGAHDMILRLPSGYDTPIQESGFALSAGQRQRVALARALYGDPFLIGLDEPGSNLDQQGELALQQAICGAKARGAIVILIAHRPSALAQCNKVLVLANGLQQAFGNRDDILSKVLSTNDAPESAPTRRVMVRKSGQLK